MEIKNSLDGLKIQMDMKEENVSEYDDRMINIIQGEEQKEDWKKKNHFDFLHSKISFMSLLIVLNRPLA